MDRRATRRVTGSRYGIRVGRLPYFFLSSAPRGSSPRSALDVASTVLGVATSPVGFSQWISMFYTRFRETDA